MVLLVAVVEEVLAGPVELAVVAALALTNVMFVCESSMKVCTHIRIHILT